MIDYIIIFSSIIIFMSSKTIYMDLPKHQLLHNETEG